MSTLTPCSHLWSSRLPEGLLSSPLTSSGTTVRLGMSRLLRTSQTAPAPPLLQSTASVSQASWRAGSFPGMWASAEPFVLTDASPESPDHYLVDHCIDGRVIFPGTGYLCLVWKTLARSLGLSLEETPVVFENVSFHQATILPKTGKRPLRWGLRRLIVMPALLTLLLPLQEPWRWR